MNPLTERERLDLLDIINRWSTYRSERFYSGYGYKVNEEDLDTIVKILKESLNENL